MYKKMFVVTMGLGLVTLALTMPSKAEEKTPPSPKVDVSTVVKGNNQFAFDLYRQLAKEAKPDENIFFSPYSISAALAMTYAGARGQTAEEMAKVLHFDRDQEKFHPAFAELCRRIRNPGKDFKGEFSIANRIWTSVDVRESFKQLMQRDYESEIKTILFNEAARQEINHWVAQQTKEKIKELLPQGAVNSATVMVLANAIYFHALWKNPFDKKETKQEKFYCTPDKAVTVPMMYLDTKLRYTGTEDVDIVELPYAGEKFSMVILLPTSHEKLAHLEKNLEKWLEWKKRLGSPRVWLSLPKFNLTCQYRLVKPLIKMGMPTPFSAADFSGMISVGARISEIYHEATIDLDEAGTTAAAATAVVLTKSGFPIMIVNRPFLFALVDSQRDTIVFVGKVMSPVSK